jgi:hypothetical protein
MEMNHSGYEHLKVFLGGSIYVEMAFRVCSEKFMALDSTSLVHDGGLRT